MAKHFAIRISFTKSIWKLNYLIDTIKIMNTFLSAFKRGST